MSSFKYRKDSDFKKYDIQINQYKCISLFITEKDCVQPRILYTVLYFTDNPRTYCMSHCSETQGQ